MRTNELLFCVVCAGAWSQFRAGRDPERARLSALWILCYDYLNPRAIVSLLRLQTPRSEAANFAPRLDPREYDLPCALLILAPLDRVNKTRDRVAGCDAVS
jgi:hypothetical protein